MIVVLASRCDVVAQNFVAERRDEGVRLLCPEDLTQPGWRHRLADSEDGTFVTEGTIAPTRDVAGVLTRLGYVSEAELTRIAPSERTYVATEISMLLLSWLSDLSCPVLNRPTPDCLSGPSWRREKWVHVAHRLGVPVDPLRRRIRPGDQSVESDADSREALGVTIVGDKHVGSTRPELVQYARALAAAARVEMLVVRFTREGAGFSFDEASFWPDLDNEDVADAVMRYFTPIVAIARSA